MLSSSSMWTVAQLAADRTRADLQPRAGRAGARAHRRSRRRRRPRLHQGLCDSARAEADYADRLRKAGVRRSPVDGLPVSLKDLFDVAGDVTRAGSRILEQAPRRQNRRGRGRAPARRRRRLHRPHQHGRVRLRRRGNQPPLRHAEESLGPRHRPRAGRLFLRRRGGAGRRHVRDGAGHRHARLDPRARRPCAAWSGFKPTARRVPRDGAFPLSFTLDSVGPLANCVPAARRTTPSWPASADARSPSCRSKGLRLMLPSSSALEDLDPEVEDGLRCRAERLSKGGRGDHRGRRAGFRPPGASTSRAAASRAPSRTTCTGPISTGSPSTIRASASACCSARTFSAADYVALAFARGVHARGRGARGALRRDPDAQRTVRRARHRRGEPSDEDYFRWNFRIMRNNGLINFLDGCAASLPCHAPGSAPVGLDGCGIAGTTAAPSRSPPRLSAPSPGPDRRAARRRFERAAATYAGASRLEPRSARACSSGSTM